jgi:ATP-dependent Lhr-like helicase
VQQILSVIAQKGGASANELWITLVRSGIFDQIGSSDFSALLHALSVGDLITQDHGGSLLPGVRGEKLINQFDFYSAFNTGEEFRILAEGRVLGALPIERPLTPGQRIIFGGRRWKVQDIDTHGKVIYVVRDGGGAPPAFDGVGGRVHNRVRQEMKKVLAETETIPFLDSMATKLLEEGRRSFATADLETKSWLQNGDGILLLGWHGDAVQDALALLLTARGIPSSNEGVALHIFSKDQQNLLRSLREIGDGPMPTIFDLKIKSEHAIRESGTGCCPSRSGFVHFQAWNSTYLVRNAWLQ